MAPAALNYARFDSEGTEMGRLPSLPASLNNNGNLFMPFASSIYVQEVEKLKRAGKVAPSTALYDPNKSLVHMCAFGNTVLKILIKSPMFWFLMGMNVVLSVIYYEVCGNHEKFDFSPMSGRWPFLSSALFNSFGGLVTFQVVIHAIDCYERFFIQYNTVRAIELNINAAINIMRTHFHDDAFEGARELRTTVAQLMVAQVYLGFGWLPTYRENGVDEWTWERINAYGLISKRDRDHLMTLPVGTYPVIEITTSCQALLQKFLKIGLIGETAKNDLYEQIKGIQGNFFNLYATTEQPVPFAVYHYISMINNMWLILVSYQWIFYSYYYGIIAVFLHVFAFLGIREMANNLAEPFGCDETDIPVFDFVVKWHTRVDNFINLPCKFGERLLAGRDVPVANEPPLHY